MSPRHRKHTARHRKHTASAKKVAKIAFTGAEFQRADHGGSGGRSAGAHAGCPPSAGPVKAQYIVRAGALAVALGLGAAVTNTPAVAFAKPTDTGSSSSSPVRRLVRRRLRVLASQPRTRRIRRIRQTIRSRIRQLIRQRRNRLLRNHRNRLPEPSARKRLSQNRTRFPI